MLSARPVVDSPCQSSKPRIISPCGGKASTALERTGTQFCAKNQTVEAAAHKAKISCTRSKRRHEALAKAASPDGVNGCQASRLFSTETSTLKGINAEREAWKE